MFFSSVRAVKARQDRRPLYRRIFTNRRLDLTHKVVIRTILGFIAVGTVFCIASGIQYYTYERPKQQEKRQLLEQELIEADLAGFNIKQ